MNITARSEPMVFLSGGIVNAKLQIANPGSEAFYNLYFYLQWPEGIRSTGPSSFNIPRLNPGENAERTIALHAGTPGRYDITSCRLEYRKRDNSPHAVYVDFVLYAADPETSNHWKESESPLVFGNAAVEKIENEQEAFTNLLIPLMNAGDAALTDIVVFMNSSEATAKASYSRLEPGQGWAVRFKRTHPIKGGSSIRIESCCVTPENRLMMGPFFFISV